MTKILEKNYSPKLYEPKIYSLWEKVEAFKPAGDPKKEPFCIILPPPNANGDLHCGHAMYVVEDVMIRYARMNNRPTLWLPGVDHAGIETQVVFERELAKQGQSRFDLGREKFYLQALDFTRKNMVKMINQIKSLGFSVDWSRMKFTLDEDILQIVFDTFKKLHDDGLIYRGNRIVNWCPYCHSGFADIEIKYRKKTDPLYYIKYGPFVVATVRPEPIFADTGIAVNPQDERYKKWIGKEVDVELLWGKRKLPVIADSAIDPQFGTGVVKLTPAHDHNDWDMAQRHGLEVIQGIGTDGRITKAGGRFAGMTVTEARDEIVKELEQKGFIDHIDMNYTHSVAYHDRCGTLIEPLVTEQWWLRVDQIKKPAITAVKKGKIKIIPKRFAKTYIDWLENLRDWNIGRQNWFGIKIPVYYNATNNKSKPDYIIALSEKEAEKVYGKDGYEAETDTFDTWFSSSQWPFATLMTTGDFDKFYPTSVMETGRDILYPWVSRMVMMGIYRTGKIPFKTIYLHGLVLDGQGKKMSKSKGNVINPLEMTSLFGTDALRLALIIGITPGNDGNISPEKIKGYRNFCNKLWNVARYTLSSLPSDFKLDKVELETPADHWIINKLNQAIQKITLDIRKYRFSEAGQAIYSLLWDDLADKYLEYSKKNLNPGVLAYSLDTILRLLHPFAPFVTESIWQQAPWTNSNLITEQWPNIIYKPSVSEAKKFDLQIIEIISTQQKRANQIKIVKFKKELKARKRQLTIIESKLTNKSFLAKAPKNLVLQEKNKKVEVLKIIKEIEEAIAQVK